jgi:hypothetical protein
MSPILEYTTNFITKNKLICTSINSIRNPILEEPLCTHNFTIFSFYGASRMIIKGFAVVIAVKSLSIQTTKTFSSTNELSQILTNDSHSVANQIFTPPNIYKYMFHLLFPQNKRRSRKIQGLICLITNCDLLIMLRKMVKVEMRSNIQNCGEVAPALLITPQKCSSSRFPRLEPIIEEGPESFQIVSKRMMFLVPTFISFVSYFLLYRYVSALN